MQQMKMAIKVFCALILALALISLMYVHFRRADLSRRVLEALRSELTTDLQVGEFEMDLLSAFPRIRFDMHTVGLQGKGGSTLLQAGELQLRMSLFSAFSDEIRFKSLSLKNGELRIERLKDGTLSLEVLDSTGHSNAVGPALHFNKISLENFAIQYHDQAADQDYRMHFKEGTIAGSYGNQLLEFDLSGNVIYDHARIGNSVYLNALEGKAAGKITLDLDQQLYSFEDLELEIADLQYAVNGSVRSAEDHEYLDLAIKQTDGDLGSFLALLPEAYRKDLSLRHVKGAFTAEGFVKGRMNSAENPHVHFDLRIDDASAESPHAKGSIHDIAIHGAFDNGASRKLNSTQLDFPVIKGKAYGQKFDASLHITDFTDPLVKCTFEGSLPASFILDYTGVTESVKEISGSMHFSDVEIGPLRLGQMDFTDIQHFEGRCALANIELIAEKVKYQIPDGILVLSQDTLMVTDLKLKSDRDEVEINGWLAELGDALEGDDPAYLHYDLTLDAGSLNLTKWIPGLAATTDMQPQARPVSSTLAGPPRLPEGQLTFSAQMLQFNDISAHTLSGTAITKTHRVEFDASSEIAGGKITSKGEVTMDNDYTLHLQAEAEGIDIQECFEQCRNFGQQVVRSEHLRGHGDIKILADVKWDLEGIINKDQMHVVAGMTVRDGELLKFDMLEQFSDYIYAEDLRHIRFERIDNFIEVRSGNIYIPAMFIQSNAVNLVVNGVHRLDNHILYNIKVNAGQVLAKKMKKHNPSLTPLPARKNGTFNLHFTIAGTMESFNYAINKRAAESSFAQSAELREQIRAQLRSAFGETIDLIEPPEWETIPEYDLEQKGEDIFLDEID